MDAVITYVDCTKRDWLYSYKANVKKPISEERFRSWGTLEWQVQGIIQHMPFIEHVYIVVSTYEQVAGLSFPAAVKIIEHKDFIPAEYLPTFNSCTIEMYLGFIPGLSNEFIYFNDDTFVVQDMVETDFFENGKPCLNPKTQYFSFLDQNSTYRSNCIKSTTCLQTISYLSKNQFFVQQHCARPMSVSSYKEVWNKFKKDIILSLTRTRNAKNCCAYLFNNYDVLTNNYVKKESNYKFYSLNKETIEDILKFIENPTTPMVCFNDGCNDKDYKTVKEKLVNWLPKNNYINTNLVSKQEPTDKPLKVALCAIAKNENLYIREWVEWYKNLGIAKIFLYDNNEIDGERFEEVINDYIQDGFVEVIDKRGVEKGLVYDNNGINLQTQCYIDCYENKVNNFDWVCFFDIDEFLTFRNNLTIKKLLTSTELNNTDTILIPWLIFTDNDKLYYENKPVVTRFTNYLMNRAVGVKSIVKINLQFDNFYTSYDCLIHNFVANKNSVVKMFNGNTVNLSKMNNNLWVSYTYNIIPDVTLNHYKTKSTEEFILRQFGRHWGTALKRSKDSLTIDNCMSVYYNINTKTAEKDLLFYNYRNNITDKIIVTLTTYPKRDKYIYNVLKTLWNEQTIKPTKVVLFLAEEEYVNKKLPSTIINSINEKLCEIRWTYNSYCHKRHEIFKEEYNSYVITIDDDLVYPKTYIEELYNYSKKYKTITEYFGFYDNYIGVKRIPQSTSNGLNAIVNLSGASICFPPKTFPLDALNYNEIRDKICPTCDESWIQPFLIKEEKRIAFLHKWDDRNYFAKQIDGSQEITMHKTMSTINSNGIRYRETCFANVLKFCNCEEIVKKIWPQFDIDKCANIRIISNNIHKFIFNNNGELINTNEIKEQLIPFITMPKQMKSISNINLDNPTTLIEKLNWLKIYDNSNLKANCADKIKLHNYSIQKLGKDICIPILHVYNSPTDINPSLLPDKFVLKCNHGYKMNLICKDKNIFDFDNAKITLQEWLNTDFGLKSLQPHYSLIERKCFAETFMTNGIQGLTDYKFWCQNGEPLFVMVINDRYNGKDKIHANIYDMNWNFFDLHWTTFSTNKELLDNKPKTFYTMIEYAKKLSEDFKFVRVDFYEINNECYLGELTFTSDNFRFRFDEKYETEFANKLSII